MQDIVSVLPGRICLAHQEEVRNLLHTVINLFLLPF
jgi:hypothetical protein